MRLNVWKHIFLYIYDMNPPIRKITLTEPCTAGSEHMAPSERGSMCSLCQKEVVDFRGKTSTEIISFFTETPKTCGKFYKGQLEWVNKSLKYTGPAIPYSFSQNKTLFLASLAALAFVPMGMKAQQQTKPHPKSQSEHKETSEINSTSTKGFSLTDNYIDSLTECVTLGFTTSEIEEDFDVGSVAAVPEYPGYDEFESNIKIKKATTPSPPPPPLHKFWQRLYAAFFG
ncbi:MAG: hypothetical protein AB8F95_07570, partial [Bacteroidia bacterium]